jgi:hypothetical protein
LIYKIPAIHDNQSAIEWVAKLPDKKCFCVKSIVLNAGNNSITETPSKLFSKEKFIEQYAEENFDTISIMFNFHQYEAVFLIDLQENTIELMFPRSTMIDYKMIECRLHLDA